MRAATRTAHARTAWASLVVQHGRTAKHQELPHAHRYTSASMREVQRDTTKKTVIRMGPPIQPHQASALGRPAANQARGRGECE